MSAWSCPHDLNGVCQKVNGARCDPGMRGCVLHGRFRFASEEKNTERKPVKAVPAPESESTTKPQIPKRRLPF